MAGTEDFAANFDQSISPYVDDSTVIVGAPGTLTFGPFAIGAWPYLMLRVIFSIGAGRCTVTWSESIPFGTELLQSFYVREDDIGVFIVPNYGVGLEIEVETTAANCNVRTFAIGTAQAVPGAQTPTGDILLFDDSVSLAAAASDTLEIPSYSGPVQFHFDADLYPWQVSVFGEDEAGNDVSRPWRAAAVSTDVNTDFWLPPHINRVTLTNNNAAGAVGRVSMFARR